MVNNLVFTGVRSTLYSCPAVTSACITLHLTHPHNHVSLLPSPHYHLQPFSYSFLPLSKKTKTKTFLQEQAVSVEEAE